ncbi:ribosomal protein L11 methyltransferase-like [Salvia splendens]|uniref:ribosomal protein L11 methyltransferase-like n=1 Tax=Salvia splendens TaxID=180675 RepID=UPI001C26B50F|nr:ribosomal protein L11 methyltransferase-like [Salvia splendens]
MSLSLSSLRSHFFKHFKFNSRASSFSSLHRRIHRNPPPLSCFSLFPPIGAGQLQQQRSAAANYSTLPFNNGASHNSFTSPYLSVHICCPKHISDALSESLMCFGASSTTIDEQNGSDSDEIWIGSTFDVEQDVNECIALAADSVGLQEIPKYKVEKQDHMDWIKQTQESFRPVEITEGLWIVPEWRKPPDPQATNIVLNPGLAFGTGEHPTTKLCLLLLHQLIKGGEYFLDYGTGSGVLAIAALKFGAHLSVGFDIEAQAITSARHNAALNKIGPEELQLSLVPSKDGAQIESKDISVDEPYDSKIIAEKDKYDVVIANVLLYPLLDLADRIVSYAKPGAAVAISGIISEQVPVVMERYSQLLEDINISMMDDWACISGVKKA